MMIGTPDLRRAPGLEGDGLDVRGGDDKLTAKVAQRKDPHSPQSTSISRMRTTDD